MCSPVGQDLHFMVGMINAIATQKVLDPFHNQSGYLSKLIVCKRHAGGHELSKGDENVVT